VSGCGCTVEIAPPIATVRHDEACEAGPGVERRPIRPTDLLVVTCPGFRRSAHRTGDEFDRDPLRSRRGALPLVLARLAIDRRPGSPPVTTRVAVDATALAVLVEVAARTGDPHLAAAVGRVVAGGVSPARPPARRWLTVTEAAEALRLSERTIRRRCQDGTLPATRVGRVWRIHPNGTYGQPDH
jgi:excisionase family DNA binding protein